MPKVALQRLSNLRSSPDLSRKRAQESSDEARAVDPRRGRRTGWERAPQGSLPGQRGLSRTRKGLL
eukprot:129733-Pleurochrysis_carterae.AAC.3